MPTKLIVALDVDDLKIAEKLVHQLSAQVKIFKIGSQLYSLYGPEAIDLVKSKGAEVFLDLKLHDIPNTVANAAGAATAKGVFMFNVHALGGLEMMHRAREAAEEEARNKNLRRPLVLAVTVLTSLDDYRLKQLGIAHKVKDEVILLAKLARGAGLDGVVASVKETKDIKVACGSDFLAVTPGIRLPGEARQDQRRPATPKEAIRAGADYIVVGRPIIQAADPAAVAQAILKELE